MEAVTFAYQVSGGKQQRQYLCSANIHRGRQAFESGQRTARNGAGCDLALLFTGTHDSHRFPSRS
jgi:hypothetical protein